VVDSFPAATAAVFRMLAAGRLAAVFFDTLAAAALGFDFAVLLVFGFVFAPVARRPIAFFGRLLGVAACLRAVALGFCLAFRFLSLFLAVFALFASFFSTFFLLVSLPRAIAVIPLITF
jgi:hypothetical protein